MVLLLIRVLVYLVFCVLLLSLGRLSRSMVFFGGCCRYFWRIVVFLLLGLLEGRCSLIRCFLVNSDRLVLVFSSKF